MSFTVKALRATMGNTSYYSATVRASTLTAIARPASEMDDWAGKSISERMQRDLNTTRVSKEIVPYLLGSQDRFFGSIIVLVHKPKSFNFEPLNQIVKDVPAAYQNEIDNIGFLTIDGGQLVILDGQHRVAAMRAVIQSPNPDNAGVGDDEVGVIFLEFESNEKTRRIFSKVNKYAKHTSSNDDRILSEDDGCSLIGRRLLERTSSLLKLTYVANPDPQKSTFVGLINWKSNSIAERSTDLTTFTALVTTIKDLIKYRFGSDIADLFDEKKSINAPDADTLDEVYGFIESQFNEVFEKFTPYVNALDNPASVPAMRRAHAPYSLLMKPVGFMALFKGIYQAMEYAKNAGEELSLENALDRASMIDWSTGIARADGIVMEANPGYWAETIVRANGNMDAKAASIQNAADIIAYQIASEWMDESDVNSFLYKYNERRGTMNEEPTPISI